MEEKKEQQMVVAELRDENKRLRAENKRLRVQNVDPSKFREWSTQEVVAWIVSLNPDSLGLYEDTMLRVMTEEGVDGECLDEDVSIADLKRWGVTLYKHSKHVLKEIKALIRSSGAVNKCMDEGVAAAEHTAYL